MENPNETKLEKDQETKTLAGTEKDELSDEDLEKVSAGALDESMHEKTAGDQD